MRTGIRLLGREELTDQPFHLGAQDRFDEAGTIAAQALELGPWCDLARLMKAQAEQAAGNLQRARETLAPLRERLRTEAPPEYVYRPKSAGYDRVHTLPAIERAGALHQ